MIHDGFGQVFRISISLHNRVPDDALNLEFPLRIVSVSSKPGKRDQFAKIWGQVVGHFIECIYCHQYNLNSISSNIHERTTSSPKLRDKVQNYARLQKDVNPIS